jgi:DNA mismatch repair protein MutS
MTFQSMLFDRPEDSRKEDAIDAPIFFVDLNLNQITDVITAGRDEYNLKPFFYLRLTNIDEIKYRHEIMQEMEKAALFEHIKSFAQKMRAMRDHLAQANKLYYNYQKEACFLDAVEIYCNAILGLSNELSTSDLKARGFIGFRTYLINYAKSSHFTSLHLATKTLKADLSTVKYCLLIKDSSFSVRKYNSEIDYSSDVLDTFEKFKQGAVRDYLAKFYDEPDMNHIEAKALEFVAQLYPDIFLAMDNYRAENSNYLDNTISTFDREIQFYIAYLEHVAKFKRAGLTFCYPKISNQCKEVYDFDGFDLALANKLVGDNSSVVCNDFYLNDKERIFVVSGPNQGGKTTFARIFGQLHYLASLGCPVPGREAQLFLFDRLFTHFEKEENIKNLRGKLQDDLVRIHEILNQATSNSIIIMNEIFTSTTLHDAIFLSQRIMDKIMDLGLLGVWVTFIEELASYGGQTVSVVSAIDRGNPTLRTFKIVRRTADGISYAMTIAEKYRLTYECLKERVKS